MKNINKLIKALNEYEFKYLNKEQPKGIKNITEDDIRILKAYLKNCLKEIDEYNIRRK